MDAPDDFRIAARAALAGPATEVVTCVAIALWVTRGQQLPLDLIFAALGFGGGVGLGFALAEALRERRGRVVGALTIVLASALATLGGEFGAAMAADWDARLATDVALGKFARGGAFKHLELALGALLLLVPLVVIRPGARLVTQLALGLGGALLWFTVMAATDVTELSLHVIVLGLALRALLFPLLLRLGDRLLDRVRPAEAVVAATGGRLAAAFVAGAIVVTLLVLGGTHDRGLRVTRLRLAATISGAPEALFHAAEADQPPSGWPSAWVPGRWFEGPPHYLAGVWGDHRRMERDHAWRGRQDALGLLERAAHQGYVPAMVRAGWLYLEAEHDPAALETGVTWLRRAARTGDVDAMHVLWVHLKWVGANDEARAWLRAAAARGHRPSKDSLARWLWEDDEADPRDAATERRERAEALRWYRELAGHDREARSALLAGLLDMPEERTREDDGWLLGIIDEPILPGSPLRRLLPVFRPTSPPITANALLQMQEGHLDEGRTIAEAILRCHPQEPWANAAMAYFFLARFLERDWFHRTYVDAARSYLDRPEGWHLAHGPTRVLRAACFAVEAVLVPRAPLDSAHETLLAQELVLARRLDPECAGAVAEVLRVVEALNLDVTLPSEADALAVLAQEYARRRAAALEAGDAARADALTIEAARVLEWPR